MGVRHFRLTTLIVTIVHSRTRFSTVLGYLSTVLGFSKDSCLNITPQIWINPILFRVVKRCKAP